MTKVQPNVQSPIEPQESREEVELFRAFDVQELVARIEFKKRKRSSQVGGGTGDVGTQESGGDLIECLFGC